MDVVLMKARCKACVSVGNDSNACVTSIAGYINMIQRRVWAVIKHICGTARALSTTLPCRFQFRPLILDTYSILTRIPIFILWHFYIILYIEDTGRRFLYTGLLYRERIVSNEKITLDFARLVRTDGIVKEHFKTT